MYFMGIIEHNGQLVTEWGPPQYRSKGGDANSTFETTKWDLAQLRRIQKIWKENFERYRGSKYEGLTKSVPKQIGRASKARLMLLEAQKRLRSGQYSLKDFPTETNFSDPLKLLSSQRVPIKAVTDFCRSVTPQPLGDGNSARLQAGIMTRQHDVNDLRDVGACLHAFTPQALEFPRRLPPTSRP